MQQDAGITAQTETVITRRLPARIKTRMESVIPAANGLAKTDTAKTTAAVIAGETETATEEDTTDNRRSVGMRNEQEVNRAIERYSDTVRRLCMIHLKNHADTEDIFQTVFLKYVLSSVSFENEGLLKSFFRSRTVSLEEIMDQPAALPEDNREILEAVLSLPLKYREVVYLHYYEEYTAPEISRILNKNVNTIYTLLTRSRQMLMEKLGGKAIDE